MDHAFLRSSESKELARYLQQQGAQNGNDAVTKDLLTSIGSEALPPTIYGIWLNASGDCQAVRAGLVQQFSRSVRHASVIKFGRLFRSGRIKEIWSALGGTSGLVAFLSQAAVRDVKHFCHELGRTWSSRVAIETRHELADELYRALCETNFDRSAIIELDRRPLKTHRQRVVPACSAELASLHVQGADDTLKKTAVQTHSDYFRESFLISLADEETSIDVDNLTSLVNVNSGGSVTYQGQRLPANDVFAICALKAVSKRDEIKALDASKLEAILAKPLFTKLGKRKVRPEIVADIIESYTQYHQKQTREPRDVSFCQNTAIFFAAQKWARRPDQLEHCLVNCFKLVPRTQNVSIADLLNLISPLPWSTRLRAFELAVRHIPSLGYDIYVDEELAALPMIWHYRFFMSLSKPEARKLFDRVITLRPDTFEISEPRRIEELVKDPTYVRLLLATEDADLLQLATDALSECRKEAEKTRKQSERCFWVQYALRCATASHDLDLYQDTLTWARKYTRDPLTAAAIYSNDLLRRESVDALCGFVAVDSSENEIDVARKVQQANVVCQEIFDLACEAIAEPSFEGFQQHQWSGAVHLTEEVMYNRVLHVNALQDRLQLSDNEIYNVVWQHTLELCLKVEAQGLEEANAKLGVNTIGGPYKVARPPSKHFKFADLRPATLRFFNDLAIRRNDLWISYRRSERPATLALTEPLPRGLPFQYLLPYEFADRRVAQRLPYLKERARQVIYTAPKLALAPPPEDREAFEAVGPCVESYRQALKHYVISSEGPREAAESVWKHAIGPLSAPRMSSEEAELFWRPIFKQALLPLNLEGPWTKPETPPDSLKLPHSNNDDDEPMEWNPDPSFTTYNVKPRRLSLTMLDIMVSPLIANIQRWQTLKSAMEWRVEANVPGRPAEVIWQHHEYRLTSLQTKEALIAAVLLYISAKNQMSPGLLAAPYPSGFDPRYPALYLDGDFLDQKELDTDSVWDILKQLSNLIPSGLLLRLVEGVLSAADQVEKRTSKDALRLLQVLVKCDKPQVTLEVVQQIILDRPEDSSWHRLILNAGLLNALSADVARNFLTSLSNGIQERLAEQASRKPEPGSKRSSIVKVTTVKLLAQLMSGADFVDEAFACQILGSILSKAKHMDIIASVAQSFIDILARSPTNADASNMVFGALEKHVLPIISSINERRPLKEHEWQRLESGEVDEMPEVYMEGKSSDIPPILSTIMHAVGRVNTEQQMQLITRILVPALEGSVRNNLRWMRLFCRHLEMPYDELPEMPLKLRFLTQFLGYPGQSPSWTFELWQRVWHTTVSPPAEAEAVTLRVREDAKLRISNAGKHWLSLFGNMATKTLQTGPQLYTLLQSEWEPCENGPTITQIQHIIIQQAEALLWKAKPDLSMWTKFVNQFSPPWWRHRTSSLWTLWHQNTAVIIKTLVRRIDALRTDEWHRDPRRRPAVLPDPFTLRLWLLTQSEYEQLPRFVPGVIACLQEITSLHTPYAERYKTLVTYIQSRGMDAPEQAAMALRLGTLSRFDDPGTIRLAEQLRVDIAKRLIEVAPEPRVAKLRNEVVDMVRSWTACPDEEVRMAGLRLANVDPFRKTGKTGQWYLDRVEEDSMEM